MSFQIWFEDEHYIAIEKPSGLFVHPSKLDKKAPDCQTLLAEERGERYQPVHRLDRATSGIVVYAKSKEATEKLSQLFRQHDVRKEYHALVRGWMLEAGEIHYPLTSKERGSQEAATVYHPLEWFECPWPSRPDFPTARYCWVRLWPLTGRKHQLRKHLSHLRHPIIGDTTHGDNRQNRLFFEQLQRKEIKEEQRMLLFASKLSFIHPYTGAPLTLHSPVKSETVTSLQDFQKEG